jgi:hypothetical protein
MLECLQARHITDHAFDKLFLIDITYFEFREVLGGGEVIEETTPGPGLIKELVLIWDWVRPLHVVLLVDDEGRIEVVKTVYEPTPGQWTSDFRTRRTTE